MRARSSKTESRGSARFGLGPWLLLASVALVMCSPNTCRAWYFNCGADTVGCLTAGADTVGCSLVVSGGQEAVVWDHHSTPTVVLAERRRGGEWSPREVASAARLAPGLSVAYDRNGQPAVAYCNGITGTLHVAWRRGGAGSAFTATDVPNKSRHVLQYPVLKTIPEGWAVAFVDSNTGTLKYAEKIGANPWKPVTVDAAHRPKGISMVVRGSARAISYYDRNKQGMWVATRSKGAWTRALIDSGEGGAYHSLADDPVTNHLGVAYYDAAHRRLKYAFQDRDGWHRTVVDAGGDVGRYCSLVQLGHSVTDSLIVTYYDATNGHLRYARKLGQAWVTDVLDSDSDVGAFSSAAVVGDSLHVVYQRLSDHTMRFLTHSAFH